MARILVINHTGKLGGPSKSALKLVKYLQPKHEAAVVVPTRGDFTDLLDQEGIRYIVNPLRLRYLPALMAAIWRERFDLIYGNNFGYRVGMGMLAARWMRRPYVWHIREIIADPQSVTGSDLRFLRQMRELLLHASAVIAVSQAAANGVSRLLEGRKQALVIYNGVDLEDFALDRAEARRQVRERLGLPETAVIGISLGYLDPRKNQLDGVEAVAQAAAPNFVLLLLGDDHKDPAYTQRVSERIKELHCEDQVRIIGFHTDVALYLRGADLLLHTAIEDPHPRSVLEGMAAGLPVLAYNVDGVGETVVDGETGDLLPLHDVKGLAAALSRWTLDADRRQRLGAAGYQRIVQSFTAAQTAQQIIRVIEDVGL